TASAAAAAEPFEARARVVGPVRGDEQVVVDVAGEDVARDALGGQRLRHRRGEADRLEGAVDVEGQPGGLEADVPALACRGLDRGDDGGALLLTEDGLDAVAQRDRPVRLR